MDANYVCRKALKRVSRLHSSNGQQIEMIMATTEELAILGGKPAFESALHVGRPNIGNRQRFEERLADILDRRWLTNGGRYVQEFEQRIAGLAGVKHCIAM